MGKSFLINEIISITKLVCDRQHATTSYNPYIPDGLIWLWHTWIHIIYISHEISVSQYILYSIWVSDKYTTSHQVLGPTVQQTSRSPGDHISLDFRQKPRKRVSNQCLPQQRFKESLSSSDVKIGPDFPGWWTCKMLFIWSRNFVRSAERARAWEVGPFQHGYGIRIWTKMGLSENRLLPSLIVHDVTH